MWRYALIATVCCACIIKKPMTVNPLLFFKVIQLGECVCPFVLDLTALFKILNSPNFVIEVAIRAITTYLTLIFVFRVMSRTGSCHCATRRGLGPKGARAEASEAKQSPDVFCRLLFRNVSVLFLLSFVCCPLCLSLRAKRSNLQMFFCF